MTPPAARRSSPSRGQRRHGGCRCRPSRGRRAAPGLNATPTPGAAGAASRARPRRPGPRSPRLSPRAASRCSLPAPRGPSRAPRRSTTRSTPRVDAGLVHPEREVERRRDHGAGPGRVDPVEAGEAHRERRDVGGLEVVEGPKREHREYKQRYKRDEERASFAFALAFSRCRRSVAQHRCFVGGDGMVGRLF